MPDRVASWIQIGWRAGKAPSCSSRSEGTRRQKKLPRRELEHRVGAVVAHAPPVPACVDDPGTQKEVWEPAYKDYYSFVTIEK